MSISFLFKCSFVSSNVSVLIFYPLSNHEMAIFDITNYNRSKTLLNGPVARLYLPNKKIFDQSKLNALANYNLNMALMTDFGFDR